MAAALAANDDSALEDQNTSAAKLTEVHERAMRRFDICALPQLELRSLALLARRFVSIPGAMWEGDFGETFENAIKLEINLTKDGLEKIYRDYNENRIVPDFRPAGGKGDDDSAQTLDGMHRADSYCYKAQQARDNAFMEAASGGMGAYRLTNEWADPYDKDSDYQRINPALAIVDADQRVFFDADAILYDKSDAKFAFVITPYIRDNFEEENPGAIANWPDERLVQPYDWFRPDVVKIAEYYETEQVDEKLHVLTHRLSGEEQRYWDSELEPGELTELKKSGWQVKTRNLKRTRVHKYVMSGAEVLHDKGLIAGECIPIVPVYGKRAFIDGIERFKGYVQDKMDSNRLYNAVVSRLAETSAMSPREIPIFAAEQMPQNLATLWSRQVVDRHAYALVEPLKDESGTIVAAGPIGKVEAPQLAPVDATIIQIAQAALTDDQQDGSDTAKANTSADALEVAAARVDAKSGIYLDNMRQSVQREGEIWLSMAADVYYEPGREVETMTEDGNDGTATLVQPYVDQKGSPGYQNDFTRGNYKVVADVTEATATRRDKTVRSNMNMAAVAVEAQNLPMANVLLLNCLMNQDGEGTGNIQKWARKQLVQLGVEEPTDEEKAEMQQAQQQQQADPEAQLTAAKVADIASAAKLKDAKAGESQASTVLKIAQAHAVAGPAEQPDTPDGLKDEDEDSKWANIRKTEAETRQIETATQHMPTKLAIEAHNAATNRLKVHEQAHASRFAGLAKLFGGKNGKAQQ
jgi:hypothetical protein